MAERLVNVSSGSGRASVLKSGPRTRKKLETELDCNRFGPDHGCGPKGFEISLVHQENEEVMVCLDKSDKMTQT